MVWLWILISISKHVYEKEKRKEIEPVKQISMDCCRGFASFFLGYAFFGRPITGIQSLAPNT